MRLPRFFKQPQRTAACKLRAGVTLNRPYASAARPQSSDIDIGFPTGAGDEDLLSALRRVLPDEFSQHPPQLVLYGKAIR